MIKFTWKRNSPTPRTFTCADVITKTALKVLENNLVLGKEYPKPTLRERIMGYFSNLWDAICGRRCDY